MPAHARTHPVARDEDELQLHALPIDEEPLPQSGREHAAGPAGRRQGGWRAQVMCCRRRSAKAPWRRGTHGHQCAEKYNPMYSAPPSATCKQHHMRRTRRRGGKDLLPRTQAPPRNLLSRSGAYRYSRGWGPVSCPSSPAAEAGRAWRAPAASIAAESASSWCVRDREGCSIVRRAGRPGLTSGVSTVGAVPVAADILDDGGPESPQTDCRASNPH